jgi:hypothetical protein
VFQKEGLVCKVRTQDPENFDEEVKSLLTACQLVQEEIKKKII